MKEGDLVRIGTNGIQQFRVVEVEGDHVRIQSTLEAPGAYPFALRLVDVQPWSE
ncbi:hypothetical protein AB0L62_33255 [Nocardia asteroides]|uniref:hypothetical protein n=1 Tax=Nocardia asteroides TaxID=1824 RepID=UPI00342D83D9